MRPESARRHHARGTTRRDELPLAAAWRLPRLRSLPRQSEPSCSVWRRPQPPVVSNRWPFSSMRSAVSRAAGTGPRSWLSVASSHAATPQLSAAFFSALSQLFPSGAPSRAQTRKDLSAARRCLAASSRCPRQTQIRSRRTRRQSQSLPPATPGRRKQCSLHLKRTPCWTQQSVQQRLQNHPQEREDGPMQRQRPALVDAPPALPRPPSSPVQNLSAFPRWETLS
mmetsp:Transcript_35130/g.82717  ORF Transcript_35130/g.82717 Transcript_35130/m.82717 type:complete len:225 (+) Transcript_35130:675-1349(+)|eukprot:3937699-Rhodomonas_salina.2